MSRESMQHKLNLASTYLSTPPTIVPKLVGAVNFRFDLQFELIVRPWKEDPCASVRTDGEENIDGGGDKDLGR